MKPLTDEELRDALRSCPPDAIEPLRTRWLYAKDFARAIEAAVNAKWEREVAMMKVSQFAQEQEANPVEQNPFTVHQIIQERNSALDMVRKVEELNAELMEKLEALQAKPVEPIEAAADNDAAYAYADGWNACLKALQAKPVEPCGYDETTGICTSDPCCSPPQTKPIERNFCQRCGKRLGKEAWDIHTCSVPYDKEMG